MLGQVDKKNSEKGLTLLEALISTAVVAIGFIAIFQMVSYSVQSVDVSNERTKSSYLSGMVAEDLIADRFADFSGKKLYEHIIQNRPTTGDKNSWEMVSCSDGSVTATAASNVFDEKKNKWDKRFSTRRVKCDNAQPSKKALKVFDICSNKDGKTCEYNHNGVHDKIYFGKMQVTIKAGEGRKKTKFLYFQIH